MNTKKPRDPLYPKGFEETQELKKQISSELQKPPKKEENDELTPLKKLNRKIGIYLSPKSIDITDNEKKRKIGIIITTLILVTLIITAYYFIIYEPSQEALSLAKTTKLNELHDLYSGALTDSANALLIENQINDARNAHEVESINIMTPATKDWKEHHKKSINLHQDKYNRTMVVYENESKSTIISIYEAMEIVNENDAKILSQIKFDEPNTVSTNSNSTDENITNSTSPEIRGCTVISIMRYEENGEIDSEYSKSKMTVEGNTSNPRENTKAFSSDVLEMIKASIINGYDEKKTFKMLDDYGVKLSNYERQINLGDLDAQYMLLIEAPQDKVSYIINNMENIVLTIPTSEAPDWMVTEISETYHN